MPWILYSWECGWATGHMKNVRVCKEKCLSLLQFLGPSWGLRSNCNFSFKGNYILSWSSKAQNTCGTHTFIYASIPKKSKRINYFKTLVLWFSAMPFTKLKCLCHIVDMLTQKGKIPWGPTPDKELQAVLDCWEKHS